MQSLHPLPPRAPACAAAKETEGSGGFELVASKPSSAPSLAAKPARPSDQEVIGGRCYAWWPVAVVAGPQQQSGAYNKRLNETVA